MTDEQFHVYSLFSGSRGNSIYIRYGNQSILIDAGKCAKTTRAMLCGIGGQEAFLRGIFVTHEHSDHIAGVRVLSKTVDVHMTDGCAPFIECEESHRFVHPVLYTVGLGDMEISSFATPHDSHESVGYIVSMPHHRVGIATDLGVLPDSILECLCDCDTVVLESNHDEDRLLRGPYPYPLKQRILSERGHLSNRACAAGVQVLAKNGVQNILLAHLSEENNTPELAFRASDRVLDTIPNCRTRLAVADRTVPTRLI